MFLHRGPLLPVSTTGSPIDLRALHVIVHYPAIAVGGAVYPDGTTSTVYIRIIIKKKMEKEILYFTAK